MYAATMFPLARVPAHSHPRNGGLGGHEQSTRTRDDDCDYDQSSSPSAINHPLRSPALAGRVVRGWCRRPIRLRKKNHDPLKKVGERRYGLCGRWMHSPFPPDSSAKKLQPTGSVISPCPINTYRAECEILRRIIKGGIRAAIDPACIQNTGTE